LTKKRAAADRVESQAASNPPNKNELNDAMTTVEAVEIDWNNTCEKCLGKMVKRRVISNEGPKIVVQCVRCRFFHEIAK